AARRRQNGAQLHGVPNARVRGQEVAHDQRGVKPPIEVDAIGVAGPPITVEAIQRLVSIGPLSDAVVARDHREISLRVRELRGFDGGPVPRTLFTSRARWP